jgi:hypothetical protein
MTNSILRAEVTEVSIGSLTIEGLMDEKGVFYVAVPQVADRFQFPIKHASRDLKALLPNGFEFPKLKTKLNPKAVNAIPLKDFEQLAAKLAFSGNELAKQFVLDLFGLSLHQLFSDSFGLQFEAKDRQVWLVDRMKSKVTRRSLTDAIKDYILAHPELSENAVKFMYSNITDATYRSLFGRSCKKLEGDLQVERHKLRDSLNVKELNHLNAFEDLAMRLIDDHEYSPGDAIREAEQRLLIKPHTRVA